MFESLRYNLKNNRKSVIKQATAWFLFGAIILVFVFLGMTPQDVGGSGNAGGAAAVVNGTAISFAQLSEISERLRRDPRYEQLQAMEGDTGRQFLQQQALSQLVEMELVRQATDRQRLWTTDAEVREVITSIPQFQDQGRFQRDRYLGYLNAARKTAGEFEGEIRREQSLRRTIDLFRSALTPLPMEAQKQKSLSEQKANLDYVTVSAENLIKPEAVSASDAKAFLADPANEAKIKDYFSNHPTEFASPETVQARHILIQAEKANAESEKAALAKVEDIAKRAKSEDFGKLARQFSDDPGSKEKNGDLGSFSRGRMVPEFEDVAFTAPLGQVSAPVKTQFGYHLIQVQARQPAKNRTIDDARESIAQKLVAQQRSQAALTTLDAALKGGDSAAVAKFIDTHGLKWQETGVFSVETETIPKLGPNEEIARLAFSLTPAKPLPSSLIRQGPAAYVIRYKPVPASKPDAKDPSSNTEMMQTFLASRRSEDVLRSWLEGLKKNASISINAQATR